MTCPSSLELKAFFRKESSAEDSARIEQHAQTCPTCYAALLRGADNDTGEHETGVLQGAPGWKAREAEAELTWQPGADLGRYVILQTLGKGGMGVVFRAYDKELDRAVALKVLHHSADEGSTSGGAAGLLREAQAMARLSHPNVVAVHDVVVLEKRVCVVMELVEGATVREWLKAQPKKGWKEIVAVYRAAAEGLAAAHDAKLVHRDFKPDNVLVGHDGRTRVTDFGIARLTTDERPAPPNATPATLPAAASELATLAGGNTLRTSITRDGQVVGTPRYMAPEQLDRAAADGRTDQFSFGVALYEALYDQHPFAGGVPSEWFAAARRGAIRPPPAGSHVPPWVHRVACRALAADPSLRFASLRELSHALGQDPSQKRNRRLAVAGASVAILVALFAAWQSVRARTQLCTGAEGRLAGVWDPERRAQMEAAFLATGLPFAADSYRLAAEALDRYTGSWAQTHQDACLATRVRGDQSDQVLTLRMTCLQERLDAVAATTELFVRADAALVGKAKQTLDGLPFLSTCSDVTRLTARLPPPEDPALATEVARIRAEIARARVLLDAGRGSEAEGVMRGVVDAAVATGHVPVRAETQLWLGSSLAFQGKAEEAERNYIGALKDALSVGHEEVLSFVSIRRAALLTRGRKNDSAMEWATFAEGVNQRARSQDVAALIPNVRGNVERNKGDFTLATDYYRQAMETAREQLGPEHMTTLGTSYNHASALQNLGRYREAKGRYEEVVAIARRTLGPRHPFLSFPLTGSGLVAFNRGDYEAAESFFSEVVELTGGKGINSDNGFLGLASVALAQGRYDDALAQLAQAERTMAEMYPPTAPEPLSGPSQKGLVLLEKGELEEALRLFDDVIAKAQKTEHAFDAQSDALRGKATILLRRGQAAKALLLAEEAVKVLVPTRGQSHPLTLESRLVVGEAQLALGRRDEARATAQAVLDEAREEFDEAHVLVRTARKVLTTADPVAAGETR